jgi:hypothetical protein
VSDVQAGRGELQLGPYARRVLRRLWLVALCVVAAVAVAALRGRPAHHTTTQASTTLSVGQPLSSVGAVVGGTVNANPSVVATIARDTGTLGAATTAAGLQRGALAGRVSVEIVGKGQTGPRGQFAPIYQLTVQGPWTVAQAVRAADALAAAVVHTTSAPAQAKIDLFGRQVQDLQARIDQLTAADQRLSALLAQVGRGSAAAGAPATAAALAAAAAANAGLEGDLRAQLAQTQVNLELARSVEAGTVVTRASGKRVETAAGSSGYTAAALAGLLVGVILALVLPPLGRRRL